MAVKQNLSSVHLDSYLTTRRVYDGDNYLAGYAVIEKQKCEIHNFISPTFRILHFLKGTSDWLIDGALCRIRQGDVVIFSNICKRNIHEVLDDSVVYEMYDFYPRILSKGYLVNVFFCEQHVVFSAGDPGADAVTGYLDRLRGEIFSDAETPGRNESIRMLLNLLAIAFRRRLGSDKIGTGSPAYRISESVQYITEHISEKVTVEEIAAHHGYTTEHYSRLFKRCFGITPVQYIINTRIENTVHLVMEEHMTVMDAAVKSGFQSSSGFYKSFKKYKGVSPAAFIRNR